MAGYASRFSFVLTEAGTICELDSRKEKKLSKSEATGAFSFAGRLVGGRCVRKVAETRLAIELVKKGQFQKPSLLSLRVASVANAACPILLALIISRQLSIVTGSLDSRLSH